MRVLKQGRIIQNAKTGEVIMHDWVLDMQGESLDLFATSKLICNVFLNSKKRKK